MNIDFEIPASKFKKDIKKFAVKNKVKILKEYERSSGYLGSQTLYILEVEGNREKIEKFKEEVKEFLKKV